MSFILESPAFPAGGNIPRRYSGEGEDLSPPLQWHDEPEGTKELVLVCDDPDAPSRESWAHWVLYKIPPGLGALPEGISRNETLAEPPHGAVQGVSSWGTIGYRGPMPPPGGGPHRYHFTLYAVDHAIELAPGASKETILRACNGGILAEARLTGRYERERKAA